MEKNISFINQTTIPTDYFDVDKVDRFFNKLIYDYADSHIALVSGTCTMLPDPTSGILYTAILKWVDNLIENIHPIEKDHLDQVLDIPNLMDDEAIETELYHYHMDIIKKNTIQLTIYLNI